MKKDIFKKIGLFAIVPAMTISTIVPIVSCSKTNKIIDFPVNKFYVREQDFTLGFASTITKKTDVIVDIATRSIDSFSLVSKKVSIQDHYGEVSFHIDEFEEKLFDFSLFFTFPSTGERIASGTISCIFFPKPDKNLIRFKNLSLQKANDYRFTFQCEFRYQPFYTEGEKVNVYLDEEKAYQGRVSLNEWNSTFDQQTTQVSIEPKLNKGVYGIDIPVYLRPMDKDATVANFKLGIEFTNRFGQHEFITSQGLSANTSITSSGKIPVDYLDISDGGTLYGFKEGVDHDWVEPFRELEIPDYVTTISKFDFFNPDPDHKDINIDRITFLPRKTACIIEKGAFEKISGLSYLDVSKCNAGCFDSVRSPFDEAKQFNKIPGVVIISDDQKSKWVGDKDVIDKKFGLGSWEKVLIKNTLMDESKFDIIEEISPSGETIYRLAGINVDQQQLKSIKVIVLPDKINYIENDALNKMRDVPYYNSDKPDQETEGRYLFTGYQLNEIEKEHKGPDGNFVGAFTNIGLCGGVINFSKYITEIPNYAFYAATKFSDSKIVLHNQKELVIRFDECSEISSIGKLAFSDLDNVHTIDFSPCTNLGENGLGTGAFARTGYKQNDNLIRLDLIKFSEVNNVPGLENNEVLFTGISVINAIDLTAYKDGLPPWKNDIDSTSDVWKPIFDTRLFRQNSGSIEGWIIIDSSAADAWADDPSDPISPAQKFLFLEQANKKPTDIDPDYFGSWKVKTSN